MKTNEIVMTLIGWLMIIGIFYIKNLIQQRKIKELQDQLDFQTKLKEYAINKIEQTNSMYKILSLTATNSIKFDKIAPNTDSRLLIERINKENMNVLAKYIYENELFEEEIINYKDRTEIIHTIRIIVKSK